LANAKVFESQVLLNGGNKLEYKKQKKTLEHKIGIDLTVSLTLKKP